jgi:hypothetical protein
VPIIEGESCPKNIITPNLLENIMTKENAPNRKFRRLKGYAKKWPCECQQISSVKVESQNPRQKIKGFGVKLGVLFLAN